MKIYAYYNSFKGGAKNKDKLKDYAQTHNHKISFTFCDDDLYVRDGIYSLFESIEDQIIKNVLVYSLDHLWSDEELHYLTVRKLKSLGADIICISEPKYSIYKDDIIKNGQSMSDYVQMLTKSISTVHLAQARKNKAMQGKKSCGTAPLGYMWNNSGYILMNDEEAETVQKLFKKYVYYKSLSKLEAYLECNKNYNRNKKPFQKGTLQKILRNDFYIGNITYDGITVKGKHQPIIDKDLFYEVNQILSSNAKNTKNQ